MHTFDWILALLPLVLVFAIAIYIIITLLTCREYFNMDRRLDRGKYAAIKAEVGDAPFALQRRDWLSSLIGLDENLTLGDKWMASALFSYSTFWVIVFIARLLWNLADPWPLVAWSDFGEIVHIGLPTLLMIFTCTWFTWGGIKDTCDLFHCLERQKINALVDGIVAVNRDLDDLIVEKRAHESRLHENRPRWTSPSPSNQRQSTRP